MTIEKEVAIDAPQLLPDHRHLRRVAEAIAGRDVDQDVWAIVRLNGDIPFECYIYSSQEEAEGEAKTRDGRWAVIPCHSEPPESESNAFFVVDHGPTSPLNTRAYAHIDRSRINRLRLIVDYSDNMGGLHTQEVDLSSHIGNGTAPSDQWPVNPQIDAVFFTLEAMDKYVFPNLVATYGTRGANTLRWRAIRGLEKDGLMLRSDFMSPPPNPLVAAAGAK